MVAGEAFEVAIEAEAAFGLDALERPAVGVGVVGAGGEVSGVGGGGTAVGLVDVEVREPDVGEAEAA